MFYCDYAIIRGDEVRFVTIKVSKPEYIIPRIQTFQRADDDRSLLLLSRNPTPEASGPFIRMKAFDINVLKSRNLEHSFL